MSSCKIYKNDEDSKEDVCIDCLDDFYLKDKKCHQQKKITYCIDYSEDKEKCILCTGAFEINNGICVKKIDNCKTYGIDRSCILCENSYTLDEDSKTCIPGPKNKEKIGLIVISIFFVISIGLIAYFYHRSSSLSRGIKEQNDKFSNKVLYADLKSSLKSSITSFSTQSKNLEDSEGKRNLINNNFEEKKEKELNNKLKKELYEIKVEDEESFKTNDRFQDQDQVSENSIQETKTSKNNGEQRDEKIQQECSNSTDFEGFEIK